MKSVVNYETNLFYLKKSIHEKIMINNKIMLKNFFLIKIVIKKGQLKKLDLSRNIL